MALVGIGMGERIVKFELAHLFSILAFFYVSATYAGQGQIRFKSTLNLEPACLINAKSVNNGVSDQRLGDINFGDHAANFTTVNTTLVNEFNAIQIYCPANSKVTISFNGGRNSANVSTVNQVKAERAMSDGAGHYIPYRIYRDSPNGTILSSQTQLTFDGGTEQQVKIYAEAYNNGQIVKGQYVDQITVTITF